MTDPQLIEIPTLDIIIPEVSIDWAWQAYTSLLLDVVEASLENIPNELTNIWTQWQQLHDRVWSQGFDLVTAMGYVNVLASEKNHELAYGKSLYGANQTVFAEALRTKNLRLYLKTRLDIEKQRQTRHIQEQGLRMEYVKGLIEASTTAYNVAVMEFNAQIAALELEGKRWLAVIAANEVLLKELERNLKEAQYLSELEKGEIRRQRALVGVKLAQAEIERLNVELTMNEVRIQAIGLEIEKAGLEALLVGARIIEEQAQALSLYADIDVINAQAREIDVMRADLSRMNAEIGNIQQISSARDSMYAAALADKQGLISALEAAQGLLETAQLGYVAAQSSANSAQNLLAVTAMNASDMKDDAAFGYSYTKEYYADQLRIMSMDEELTKTLTSTGKEARNAEILAARKAAESKAAEALKKAYIINRFTEYR